MIQKGSFLTIVIVLATISLKAHPSMALINHAPTVKSGSLQSHSDEHFVGELYGGGVVFWVDSTGKHGLICSMIDLSIEHEWSNVSSTEIGETAQSAIDGHGNTKAIVEQNGHTSSAAKLCLEYTNADYGTGIYTDWYLPAKDELNYLLQNISGVQEALENDSNSATTVLAQGFYWSSSEVGNDQAYAYFFYGGLQYLTNSKDYKGLVRAVRSF
jgi:hypothetical protein